MQRSTRIIQLTNLCFGLLLCDILGVRAEPAYNLEYNDINTHVFRKEKQLKSNDELEPELEVLQPEIVNVQLGRFPHHGIQTYSDVDEDRPEERNDTSDDTPTGSESRAHLTDRNSAKRLTVDKMRKQQRIKHSIFVEKCKRGLIFSSQNVTWKESNCTTCRCQSSQVICERPQCPKLNCASHVQVEKECCPQCPEKLCQSDDGRRFQDGAEWHKGDCTFCECRKGKVLCSIEDCQIPHCQKTVKVPGQCCPVCLDSSCHASNGTRIPAGEVWKEGVCTHCYCAGGERKCAEEKCPFINCSDSYRPEGKCCYRCRTGAVDCVASRFGTWSECPIQECGGGMRRRFRSELIPYRNGGNFCPHMSEAQICPRLPCNILPVCPVTEWSSWSHCTSTCGTGRRMRSRVKAPTTKATMTSLMDCSTTHMQETTHCDAGRCLSDKMIGKFREMELYDDICYDVRWTEWNECSAKCGVGVQRRHQVLLNESHPRGHLCHLLDETRKCHGHNCDGSVVRCKVSNWSSWSPCSQSCGPRSEKTKYRTMLRKSENGGRPCPRLFFTKLCKAKPCKMPSPTESNKCVSENGKRIFMEGEHWLPRPCLSCRCINSRRECEELTCERTDCRNPRRFPGLCCPLCTD